MPERVCFKCGFTHDGDKTWCESCIRKAKEGQKQKPKPKGNLGLFVQEVVNMLGVFIAVISMVLGL